MISWEGTWYRPAPLRRLALFRIAVAWLCLYDAFLYDPTALLRHAATVEATWNPLVIFQLLGIEPVTPETSATIAVAHRLSALFVLVGFRTRTACLALALLAFWQGGMLYSLTKVRHDRVALCFATFALACSPSGARMSLDAWLRRETIDDARSPYARWPLVLTQATIAIGYSSAGLTKLLHGGWLNGYTLQGIVLGHRGTYADVAAASPLLCQLMSVVTVFAELLCPLCVFVPRLSFLFVPLLVGFHWSTWATMDTGPYMTLWFLLVAFVPADAALPWLRGCWSTNRPLAIAAAGWAGATLLVVGWVMLQVVPVPWLIAAAAANALLLSGRRWRRDAATSAPAAA